MSDAYIFVGSNIDRDTNFVAGIQQLRALGRVIAVSPVYDTPALGDTPAPRYYNGAVLLDTELAPHALRNALREIEARMGRVRSADKNAPRQIDLDLVLYGEVTINDGELQIPDPLLFERGFMAIALAHISPDFVIPPDGPTLAELACQLRAQTGELTEVPAMSERVRALLDSYQTGPVIVKPRLHVQSFDNLEWDDPMPPTETTTDFPSTHEALERAASHQAIADAVRTILINVGEDPDRQGLVKTPDRVARAYDELLAGYKMDPVTIANGAFFDTEYNDMVVVKDIEFYSMCEHHMLPFFGKVHVAYIPNGKVLGLSKVPRIVEMYARRLQLQEQMTQEIAETLRDLLHPRGVAVIVTGQHMCSMMRGVNKPHSKMVTQALYGDFEDPEVRAQLNDHLRDTNN